MYAMTRDDIRPEDMIKEPKGGGGLHRTVKHRREERDQEEKMQEEKRSEDEQGEENNVGAGGSRDVKTEMK